MNLKSIISPNILLEKVWHTYWYFQSKIMVQIFLDAPESNLMVNIFVFVRIIQQVYPKIMQYNNTNFGRDRLLKAFFLALSFAFIAL